MGELFKWPSFEKLPGKEVHEEIKQIIFFEFANGDKRREAMEVLNKLRNEREDIFVGSNFIKIDKKREYQGLELSFSTDMEGRGQKILDLLHEKGIFLNTNEDGVEEKPHPGSQKDFEEA